MPRADCRNVANLSDPCCLWCSGLVHAGSPLGAGSIPSDGSSDCLSVAPPGVVVEELDYEGND